MDDSSNPDYATLKFWLALVHAPGLGSRGFNRLLEHYKPEQLVEQPVLAKPLKQHGPHMDLPNLPEEFIPGFADDGGKLRVESETQLLRRQGLRC